MRRTIVAGHLLAASVVAVGLAGHLIRPTAPALGPPPDPGRWFEPGYLDLAVRYRTPLYVVGLAALTLRVAVPALAAWTRQGRALVGWIVDRTGRERPARAAAFVVLAVVVTADLLVLPLAFWAGFVHEGRWGFRTQGLAGWVYDWVAAVGPVWLAVAVLTLVGSWLAVRLGDAWPPVAGLGAAALSFAVVFMAPLVLEPLLFRTVPLPEGAVREEVETVLARSGLDVDRILVADASRRTTKRNAYISGFGPTRRVVLYDTLVASQAPDEVGLVLAHELGHARHQDVLRNALLSAAGAVAATYALWFIAGRRVRRGHQPSRADPRGMAALVAVVVLLNLASAPIQQWASRRAEAAADLAALDLSRAPETFAAKTEALTRANLGQPRPPTWAYVLWSTHPMPVSRLEMAERWPEFHPEAARAD